MDFFALIPTNGNTNIFSSLNTATEMVLEAPQKVELLDVFITQFPRLSEDDAQPSNFAFSYFEDTKVDFMKYQDSVQILSNILLGHTQPLNEFEQTVLNKSYAKSLKTTPSRSNRL